MVRLEPVPLARHGTRIRAQVCACPECAPVRAEKRLYNRHRRHMQPHHTARDLTPADWEAIERLYKGGLSLQRIANALGLGYHAFWAAAKARVGID